MFQVRFHGRGGQGVVTAAELLASAAFREDRYAQALPSFGSERMGASGDVVLPTAAPGTGCRARHRGRKRRLEEGVTMRCLSTVAHAGDGKLVIEKMRLDQTGFPQPTGEFEELAADCLVLALGQDADLAVLDGVPGVTFSGGPALRGARLEPAPRPALAGYGELNTWYYADAPATVRPRLAAARRTGTFDEVTGGLDESTALFEARRCMSCGICAAECPCGAIAMVPEEP